MAKLSTDIHAEMDIEEFTNLTYKEGWSDGLSVLPPIEKRVRAILDYLNRDPKDVIGVIPPSEDPATIEQIAINCAMAGCKPEYVPVVIAAIEAMLEEEFQLALVQSSQAGAAPCAIISGPVVKQLGFNYDRGVVSGDGSRTSGTVGRAIALTLWNSKDARARKNSLPVFGHLGKYSYVMAERPPDDSNPWEQFHVSERGLNPEDSAVTMLPSGRHEQIGSGSGLEQTLDDLASKFSSPFNRLGHMQEPSDKLLILNPLATKIFADEGWSREQLKEAIAEKAKRTVGDLKKTCSAEEASQQWWGKLGNLDDDALVSAVSSPNSLAVLVSGGWPSPASPCLCINSIHGRMVTKRIDWNW